MTLHVSWSKHNQTTPICCQVLVWYIVIHSSMVRLYKGYDLSSPNRSLFLLVRLLGQPVKCWAWVCKVYIVGLTKRLHKSSVFVSVSISWKKSPSPHPDLFYFLGLKSNQFILENTELLITSIYRNNLPTWLRRNYLRFLGLWSAGVQCVVYCFVHVIGVLSGGGGIK